MKELRSLDSANLVAWIDSEITVFKFRSIFFSVRIRIIPITWRLSAKGSLSPEGFSPILNKPIKVSILSAMATISPTVLLGSVSPENLGL